MAEDRAHFFQFYTLVQEKGGIVLRNVIHYMYDKDGFYNFEQFLNHYKHKLFHELWHPNKSCCPSGGSQSCHKSIPNAKPVLTNMQWNQLYKQSKHSLGHGDVGPCPCKWIPQTATDLIDQLDVTLLCHILKTIYAAQKLSQSQCDAIDLIRSERNKLSHPNALKVDDFTSRWEEVKTCLLDLANVCVGHPPDQLKNLGEDIDKLKIRKVTKEDFEKLETKINLSENRQKEQLNQIQRDISNMQGTLKKIRRDRAVPTDNCSVVVKVQSQFEDIEKTEKLIENAQGAMNNASQDSKGKLDSFISELHELKESFEECKPFENFTEDDLEDCCEEYKQLVGSRGKRSLQECWKDLEAKFLIVYNRDEYEALDDEDWKEIEDIRYPVDTVKKKNERKKIEIDKKLQKAIIEEHICTGAICDKEMRVVIVGKTGVGKSALGNLLLQIPNYFAESIGPSSETAKVKEGSRMLGNRKLRVLDTPGLFDTNRSLNSVKRELAKCFVEFRDGLHAMAVVLNGSNLKFTEEEQKALAEIKSIFGVQILKYCFVVITHMGGIKKNITAEQFVKEIEQEEFKLLIYEDFGQRLMFVENTACSLYEQKGFIKAFIGMVDNIHQKLNKTVYTDAMFEEAKKIGQIADDAENERMNKQIMEEIGKYNALWTDIKKLVKKKLPSEKKIRQMSVYDDSRLKEDIIKFVSASLNREQEEYIKKYPDKDLVRNICIEIIEKKKKKILGSEAYDDGTVTMDDISVSIDNNNPVIEDLFRDLHDFVGDIVGNYLEDATTKEETWATKEVSSDEIKTMSEKVRNKLSVQAKEYFSTETIEKEIKYKVQKKKNLLTEVEKTTESKLKSSGEGGGVVCFPADGMIFTSRGSIYMSDIKVGDQVLTYDLNTKQPKYEDVILLSHAEHDPVTEMIRILTSASQTITLSPGHLLHLNFYGNLVPARLVTKGDNLCVYINNRFVWSQVTSVFTVKKKGLYCPHTTGGSIIVNGVLASCGTEHVSQSVTNASLYVIKMLYWYLPSAAYEFLYGRNRKQDVPYLLNVLKPIYFKEANCSLPFKC